MGIKKDLLIKLLTCAKHNIASGKDGYVCCAIERAITPGKTVRWDQDERDHASYLQRWISDSLGVHSTVRSWLYYEKGIALSEMSSINLLKYRLAWVDNMILGVMCER